MFSKEERLNYIYTFVQYDGKDIELDFWQDEFIKSADRFINVLKSRRTGFSFATGLKGLVKAMDPDRTNYTKQFVSYNESDALEKIRYAKAFYDSIPTNNKKKCITDNKSCLEFQDINSGTVSRLISFPCRAPRGKGGDISLDEFGIFLPRMSKVVYQAGLYCIARGGCIEVGSTPLGKIGMFYDICTDREKFPDYRRFTVPWWYSKALCTDVDTALKEAEFMTTEQRVTKFGTPILQSIYRNSVEEDFQQECECMFIDSSESYITLDLIYANTPGQSDFNNYEDVPEMTDNEFAESSYGRDLIVYHDVDEFILNYNPEIHGKPLYFGYDVAKLRDAVSIIGIGLVKGEVRRMNIRIETHELDFEGQKDTVRKIMKKLPVYKLMMDLTGMGLPIYEELYKEFGDRICGIHFDLASKEEMAMNIKFALEKHLFLLENDKDFHRQIHSIKRIPSLTGKFRYDADRENGVHADSFWALALANMAVIGVTNTTNFYQEWKNKKDNDTIILYNEDGTTKEPNNTRSYRRGKSLNQILRGIK